MPGEDGIETHFDELRECSTSRQGPVAVAGGVEAGSEVRGPLGGLLQKAGVDGSVGLLPKAAVSPVPSPLFQRMCLSSRPRTSGTQSFMLSLLLQGKAGVRVRFEGYGLWKALVWL